MLLRRHVALLKRKDEPLCLSISHSLKKAEKDPLVSDKICPKR